ncbi:MAG: aminoglycoside phosphotransferase family protein [Asgard group archaeon]|nr:aminoglycoside phosphotransferase family protein [Asgard group archaeon]
MHKRKNKKRSYLQYSIRISDMNLTLKIKYNKSANLIFTEEFLLEDSTPTKTKSKYQYNLKTIRFRRFLKFKPGFITRIQIKQNKSSHNYYDFFVNQKLLDLIINFERQEDSHSKIRKFDEIRIAFEKEISNLIENYPPLLINCAEAIGMTDFLTSKGDDFKDKKYFMKEFLDLIELSEKEKINVINYLQNLSDDFGFYSNGIFLVPTWITEEHYNRIRRDFSFRRKRNTAAIWKYILADLIDNVIKTSYNKIEIFEEKITSRTRKIFNEAKIRQKFIDKGVQCVPAPICVDQEFFKNGAVVFDFAEGIHSDYQDESTIKKMARNLADIHNVEYEIIPDGLEQMKKNHQFLKKTMNHIEVDYPHLMNPSISKAFSLAQEEYEVLIDDNKELFPFGISGILHGDLGGHFITDSQGKLWLVDWENSEYGDIVEEICTFVFYSGMGEDLRKAFFNEYKIHFPPASDLDFKKLGYFYIFPMPALNLCWGMDQLDTNLIHKLEPERKLVDINKSAKNWKNSFTETTSDLIEEGVNELTLKLINEYNLCL